MRSAGPRQLSVLASGGGIAGPTLACQLARAGHRTTVDFRDEDGESACSAPPHAVAAVGIEEVPAEVLSRNKGQVGYRLQSLGAPALTARRYCCARRGVAFEVMRRRK